MLRVTRFVEALEGFVASDPRISSIPLGDPLPQPYGAVVMVFVVPKRRIISWIIGVPVQVLAAEDVCMSRIV